MWSVEAKGKCQGLCLLGGRQSLEILAVALPAFLCPPIVRLLEMGPGSVHLPPLAGPLLPAPHREGLTGLASPLLQNSQ